MQSSQRRAIAFCESPENLGLRRPPLYQLQCWRQGRYIYMRTATGQVYICVWLLTYGHNLAYISHREGPALSDVKNARGCSKIKVKTECACAAPDLSRDWHGLSVEFEVSCRALRGRVLLLLVPVTAAQPATMRTRTGHGPACFALWCVIMFNDD